MVIPKQPEQVVGNDIRERTQSIESALPMSYHCESNLSDMERPGSQCSISSSKIHHMGVKVPVIFLLLWWWRPNPGSTELHFQAFFFYLKTGFC